VPPVLVRLAREPLVHFALLGAAVFAIDRALAPEAAPRASGDEAEASLRQIVIEPSFVDALARQHVERTGRPPTAEQTRGLVADFVREEALYREARALGLDGGDLIVRRRLVQKMEFLVESTTDVPEPTDTDLQAHLAANTERFRQPARTSFAHVFFSRDRRGERTRDDAARALPAHRAGAGSAERGDPFLLGADFAARARRDLEGTFGTSFATALDAAPIDVWSEPIESAYGSHLVRVTARTVERVPPLAEIRDAVAASWRAEAREHATAAAIDELVASYRVDERRPDTAMAEASP
jgi:hypothetical protein